MKNLWMSVVLVAGLVGFQAQAAENGVEASRQAFLHCSEFSRTLMNFDELILGKSEFTKVRLSSTKSSAKFTRVQQCIFTVFSVG